MKVVTTTHDGQVLADLGWDADGPVEIHIEHQNVTVERCRMTTFPQIDGVPVLDVEFRSRTDPS